MKITKAILLSVAVVASACSEDDDNTKKSNLESVKFSLASETTLIEAPEGMENSENQYAIMARTWMLVANGLTEYAGYLQAPAGATKSKTRITAVNGRTKTTGDVLVYSWYDDQTELTIAYQISEESDKYVFEIFLNEANGSNWYKFVHAEESKDGNTGLINVIDVEGENASKVLFEYSWAHEDDGDFTLTYKDYVDIASITFIIGSNGSGIVTAYEGTGGNRLKVYQIDWNDAGAGNWMHFDEEGTVDESGSWEV